LDKAGIVVTTGPKNLNNALDNGAMRLICPNCGAQYEVADDAIPLAGRDVQCSNCSHGWFQQPLDRNPDAEADTVTAIVEPDVPEAHMSPAATELEDDVPADVLPQDLSANDPIPEEVSMDAPEDAPEDKTEIDEDADPDDEGTSDDPPLPDRSIDDNLLAVLREEAERETSQRRAEAARPIETQGELGIDSVAPAAIVAPVAAPPRPAANSAYAHLSSDQDYEASIPEASVRPAARRDLLPDVEEISSTLRSSGSGRDDDDNPMPDLPPIRKSGGFRSGFLLSVLLAVMLMLAYILAPRLAEQFPAAKGALDSYVVAVDALRTWLRSVVASLTGMIESKEG
jgi:predicted Zn finger-like uncharacterized protein